MIDLANSARRRTVHQAFTTALAALLLVVAISPAVPADGDGVGATLDHPPVADPAALDGAAAERIYRAILARMQAGYARSGDPVAWQYARWARHNIVPYRSHQHGQVFVNNYVNKAGDAYGMFDAGNPLPAGTLIAKDSFVVTQAGEIMAGPLALMEKMPAGFDPDNGDWRYLQIAPDGTLAGVTLDAGNDPQMNNCVACHAGAPEDQDRLFYVPPEIRR